MTPSSVRQDLHAGTLDRCADESVEPLDVVGVGFGPSNLALAIAIDEHNRKHPEDPIRARFLERQPDFRWHQGMLIDGATMQVSFLKDLVTLRDPTSDYSFLSYLRDQGRLIDFINHKAFFPSRIEFYDYLSWAARRLDHLVTYDAEVTAVNAVAPPGQADAPAEMLEVVVNKRSLSSSVEAIRAANLVIATGITPRMPMDIQPGARVWHSSELLPNLARLEGTEPRRLVVLGAGQSAAEVAEYVHRRFPSTEVCAVFTRYGYAQADDTPFANRVFDPAAVDHYYAADPSTRRKLMEYHRSTNYSAVDTELLEELYRRHYQEKVANTQRLRFLNASRIVDCESEDEGVRLQIEFLPTGERTELACDALVCATGYRPSDPCTLLGDVSRHCHWLDDGSIALQRDYRVATGNSLRAGIYIQGSTEHTHGISSSLLSNIAVRAGELLDAFRCSLPEQRAAIRASMQAVTNEANGR